MANIMLDRASRFAREYQEEANSAWDAVKREHDEAMVACAVEDAVSFGCFVLAEFPKAADRWPRLVSEDINRYDEVVHKQLEEAEDQVVQTSQLIMSLLDQVSAKGYSIEKASEFRHLANQLFSAAGMSPDSPHLSDILKAKRKALDDHRAGRTIAISGWNQRDE